MALLPIFCVARSSRTDLSMLVARALKIGKSPTAVCLLLMRRCTRCLDRLRSFLRPLRGS